MRHRPIEERFSEKYVVDLETGCWNWTGSKIRGLYGMLGRYRQTAILAHKFAYEHFKGPIPKGQVVRHSCHNPSCVNPDHLMIGTHADNMKDLDRSGRARIFSSEDVRRINELLQTFSQNAVARLYNTHRTTISRAMQKAQRGDYGPMEVISGGDKQHIFLSEDEKSAAVDMMRKGEPIMRIAQRFDVDRKTIRNLRPSDVKPRPTGRPRQREKEQTQ